MKWYLSVAIGTSLAGVIMIKGRFLVLLLGMILNLGSTEIGYADDDPPSNEKNASAADKAADTTAVVPAETNAKPAAPQPANIARMTSTLIDDAVEIIESLRVHMCYTSSVAKNRINAAADRAKNATDTYTALAAFHDTERTAVNAVAEFAAELVEVAVDSMPLKHLSVSNLEKLSMF